MRRWLARHRTPIGKAEIQCDTLLALGGAVCSVWPVPSTRAVAQEAPIVESRIGWVRGDNLKRESCWIGHHVLDDDRGAVRSAEHETQIDRFPHRIRRGIDGCHRRSILGLTR
jgi:hypothetical protein